MNLHGRKMVVFGALVCAIISGCTHAQNNSNSSGREIASANMNSISYWNDFTSNLFAQEADKDAAEEILKDIQAKFNHIQEISDSKGSTAFQKSLKISPIVSSLRTTLTMNAAAIGDLPFGSLSLSSMNSRLVSVENAVYTTSAYGAKPIPFIASIANTAIANVGSSAAWAARAAWLGRL